MARYLNMNCDFIAGYLVCDIPRDTIKVQIKIKTRWGKHILTDDKERKWRSSDHGEKLYLK